jgi:hypothetical protein
VRTPSINSRGCRLILRRRSAGKRKQQDLERERQNCWHWSVRDRVSSAVRMAYGSGLYPFGILTNNCRNWDTLSRRRCVCHWLTCLFSIAYKYLYAIQKCEFRPRNPALWPPGKWSIGHRISGPHGSRCKPWESVSRRELAGRSPPSIRCGSSRTSHFDGLQQAKTQLSSHGRSSKETIG